MRTAEDRFWSKVDRNGPVVRSDLGPCWVWTAALRGGGYGHFYVSGGRRNPRYVSAHRFSWEIANGVVPAGLNVLHRCDNRCCVRPSHLFVGTQAENIADARAKHRGGFPPVLSGPSNGRAKVTLEQVAEIRRRCFAGERQRDVGASFGLTQASVSKIVREATWKAIS